jgi:hypothetical protein
MDAEHRRALDKHYDVRQWHGRSARARRSVKGFHLEGSEVAGWVLERLDRDEKAKPAAIHSLWRRGEATDALIALDIYECASVKAAHDQLLELLATMQSGAIERLTDKTAPGDVAFGLANTMLLFAYANVTVLVRNAGPVLVPVRPIARAVAQALQRPAD